MTRTDNVSNKFNHQYYLIFLLTYCGRTSEIRKVYFFGGGFINTENAKICLNQVPKLLTYFLILISDLMKSLYVL